MSNYFNVKRDYQETKNCANCNSLLACKSCHTTKGKWFCSIKCGEEYWDKKKEEYNNE